MFYRTQMFVIRIISSDKTDNALRNTNLFTRFIVNFILVGSILFIIYINIYRRSDLQFGHMTTTANTNR